MKYLSFALHGLLVVLPAQFVLVYFKMSGEIDHSWLDVFALCRLWAMVTGFGIVLHMMWADGKKTVVTIRRTQAEIRELKAEIEDLKANKSGD